VRGSASTRPSRADSASRGAQGERGKKRMLFRVIAKEKWSSTDSATSLGKKRLPAPAGRRRGELFQKKEKDGAAIAFQMTSGGTGRQ